MLGSNETGFPQFLIETKFSKFFFFKFFDQRISAIDSQYYRDCDYRRFFGHYCASIGDILNYQLLTTDPQNTIAEGWSWETSLFEPQNNFFSQNCENFNVESHQPIPAEDKNVKNVLQWETRDIQDSHWHRYAMTNKNKALSYLEIASHLEIDVIIFYWFDSNFDNMVFVILILFSLSMTL